MAENKHTLSDLYQMQSLSLDSKISMTRRRIQGWIDEFGEDGVYVSLAAARTARFYLILSEKIIQALKQYLLIRGLNIQALEILHYQKKM